MIKGLDMAGPTASHADVIKALRSIKSYNGNGLLPENINFTNDFGKDLPGKVVWVVHEGGADVLRRRLQPALVRHRHSGHNHRFRVKSGFG